MPFFTVLLFFVIFLEVSIFSLCHAFLSVYFGNENATFALLLETFLTGIVAIRMLKQQGLKSFIDLQKVSQFGSTPEWIILSQLANLISALLLLIPGILSDIGGLLILYPPIKKTLFKRVLPDSHNSIFSNIFQSSKQWSEYNPEQQYQNMTKAKDDIIDVEVEDLSQNGSK